MYLRLAAQIRKQLPALVDQYDTQLRNVPGYANVPEPARRDWEQQVLQTIAGCLEVGDDSALTQYIHERAEQLLARGFEPEWLQQAVTLAQELITPLVKNVTEGNFVWRAMNRAQITAWQIVAGERRQIETTLRESEARYQTIFNSTPIMFWLKDTHNRTLRINRAAATLEGVNPADVEGKSAYDLYPHEQAEAFYQDDLAVINSGKPKLGIIEQHTSVRSSKLMWLETGKTPVHNDQGETIGVLAFAVDITERKQAEEALRHSAELQQRTARYLRATLEATDELMRAPDLDTVCCRSVELAREKFDIERCGLYLIDQSGQYMLGTYGTDDQRRTTDERGARRTTDEFESILTASAAQLWVVRESPHRFVENQVEHILGAGWVAGTVLRGATGPLGILFNDAAISRKPVDEAQQEALAVYCSAVASIIERKRAEEERRTAFENERTASERLRAIVTATDELIRATDLDMLCRRAVELAREKLGVERCALYILDESREWVLGTYGTDAHGQTTDEHSNKELASHHQIISVAHEQQWVTFQADLKYWEGGQDQVVGAGWNVATAIRSAVGPIGILFNDAAITRKPYEEGLQQALALYCSMLANIIENKRLELQIRQSLQLRSNQVQTSTEVAQEIAAATDLNELFSRVVTLIKERFDYYHAQLFRYDPARDAVVLITGYGQTGQKMLEAGHTLHMGRGVVGTAAATGQSILASDVRQDADWRPNPNLPETRGELAVPIKWRDQVLGILDVQSDRAGALSDDDRLLLEGLCGQIASAMESTRLLEEQRRSEAELSQALQIAKLAYWEYDVEKDLFLFNDQFYAIFHTTAEQEGGYQLSSAQYAGKFVYPDDLSMVGSEIERALNSTDRHYSRDLVHRIQYADGGVGYISVNINIDRDEQGHILRYYGANQDITESKLAEVEMQRTQRFLDSIVENIPIMLFVKDAQDLRFVRWNKAGEDLMGFSRAEMLGKNDLDIVPLEEAELFMASDRQVLIDKEPLDIPEESLETRFKGIRTLHTRKIPILDQQGNAQYLLGISEDITDSKQAEAERERLITEQQTRAVQLQTAAEIGRVATSILNPDQLLSEIVELIAARLGVYHVAVFTVDESGRWALIRSATGEVGQQLKDRGQALGIRGQSIVGNAIQRRQPRIALDVGAEAVQFKDPLLPATRSEIALPLFVGDQVLGALDIQSTEPAAFDENSAIVLQSMADQIAVALNNAEKYQREQAQVEQTNRLMQIVIDLSEPTDRTELQNRLVRSALSLLDTDRAQVWLKGASGLELKAAQSIRPGADQSLAISQELADRVCHTGQPLRLDSPPLQAGYASRITDVPFNAALMMPISWQSQTTGVLSVMRSQPGRPFTQDDENSAQLLAAQASAALENIALSEHQQHRSVQLQTAAEVSRAASSILKLDELLPEAVELIRARFNFYYVGIFLADEAERWAVLRAGTGEAGQQMLANAHQLEIGGASMISQCIVKQQARIALDVGEEAIRFDNPLLPLTRSEMALPLTSRGRIIGAMSIQSDQPAAFSPDDITVLQSMADQISNAVENARLYERVQVALGDTDQLLQASAELNVSQTYAEVLDVVRKYTTLGQDAQTIAINVFDRPWTDDQTPVWIELIGFFTRRPSGMEIGTRFPIALFPAAKALLRPDAPSVFEDLDTAQTDPNTHALFVQRLASKSVIFMPLVVGGQWFGYMNVMYPNPSQFNEADVRRLMAMVRQAAVAVQNLRHLAASQQALTETDASYRATQAIGRAQSVEAILEATTHVVDLLGMTRATLHVVTRRDIANVVTATDMYAFHQIAGQWVLQPSVKDAPISGAATIRSLQRQPDAVVIYADAQNPNSPMPDEARQTLLADALRGAIATSASLQNEVLGFLSFSGPQPLNEAAEQRLRLTIRTLSDQVAVALQNRLLFEQTRAALQEVDAINRRLTGEAWDTYLHQQTGQDVIWAADDDLAAPAYLAQLDDQLAAGEITLEPDPEDQSEATVTAPILLRGQPIGVLRMRTPLNAWNNDSEAVLTDIAGHIAQAVENARLIEQTQRTASRERMINEINARVRQTVTIDSILETAVKELGKSLTATHVFARVSRPETLEDGHDRTG